MVHSWFVWVWLYGICLRASGGTMMVILLGCNGGYGSTYDNELVVLIFGHPINVKVVKTVATRLASDEKTGR